MATQAEQRWIAANQQLAQSQFGSLNPPDGQVGQFVQQWYASNPGTTPDATDGPILQEIGAGAPTGVTLPDVNQTNAGGFTSLIGPVVTAPAFTEAPGPNIGGNYRQVQNATQAGQFGTVGSNYQQQTGTTGQTQAGTQQTTGAQTTAQQQQQATEQQQAQDSRTSGTTTQATAGKDVQEAIDTLGFGKLLRDQAGSVGASDAERTAWLKDTMQTGGTGFNSQIDQAVRQSQTGPGMTGAGDSSRARKAGYAAAEIGRTNLNQRLAASEQLAGPTGLASLSTAANPFVGKSTTSSGTGTTFQDMLTKGTMNTTGTTTGSSNTQSLTDQLQKTAGSTTGFQDLVTKGAEAQAGSTLGQSSQSGAGQIPQGQPVKTGGCVLCTAAVEMKLPKANMLRVLRRVINHKLNVDRSAYRNAARGYFAVFTPFARYLLTHPFLAVLLWPLARAVVYEELRLSGRRLPWKPVAWGVHWAGHSFCVAVGAVFPVRGYVTDPVITEIARKNNILFKVEGN